jgi:hypothetical protein
MPRSASMTDGRVGTGTTDSPYVTITPADVLGPMLAPTTGVRGWVDSWRYGAPAGRQPGVHPDVVTGAARQAQPGDDVGPGDELLEVDDERINSGEAQAEFDAHAARHREGTWPRPALVVDRRAVRNGYGPGVVLD